MPPESVVDVAFPLNGKSLPLDHGYALYGALARVLPVLHAEHRKSVDGGSAPASWGVHPVRGLKTGPGLLSPCCAIRSTAALDSATLPARSRPET